MYHPHTMKLFQDFYRVLILMIILTIPLFVFILRDYEINVTIVRTSHAIGIKSTEHQKSTIHTTIMQTGLRTPGIELETDDRLHGNETNDARRDLNNAGAVNFTLNLPIDLEEHTPSIDELYQRIAIVSAFSQNHYLEALSFIASAQKYMPDKKIIIYDLGIKESVIPKVKKLCNVELRSFPWQSYPDHVKNLHNYAWKPIIIDITLREFGAIFWGDASIRFKTSLKDLIPASTRHHGYMSHWHSFDPKTNTKVRHQYYFTHPDMYASLDVDRRKYYASRNEAAYPAANRQLYINGSVIQRAVVQPMLRCSLKLHCIAPEGSKIGEHRYDASLLAILVYKNMKKEWTPQNNDNAIFDRTIDIQRSTKGHEKARTCANQ
ncbi:uncharacterized protein LOC129256425 [Lytechinus pictus]|uniref:uncharacterized protein LOC129256425 n=1 Tax=Lytechinus pictus TaxID=7653 RepID=UPI0030B9C397